MLNNSVLETAKFLICLRMLGRKAGESKKEGSEGKRRRKTEPSCFHRHMTFVVSWDPMLR